MPDDIAVPATENDTSSRWLTSRAREIAYILAYRQLDIDARRALAMALPRLDCRISRDFFRSDIENRVVLTATEYADEYGLDGPVRALVRLDRGCGSLQYSPVRFRWHSHRDCPGIWYRSWLNGYYIGENPGEAGMDFAPLAPNVLGKLLVEIDSDDELQFG